MSLKSEIFEQPEVLAGLLQTQSGLVAEIAREIQRRDPAYVFMVARGTSDNAARYAQYLWGAHNRLPIALATPSLFTMYDSPPRLRNTVAVAVSQSGKSPDIVETLANARSQGNLAIAITNTAGSPLAQAADFVIETHAGVEKAVAATKTFTSQMMVIAMLSQAMSGLEADRAALEAIPGWVSEVLALDEQIGAMAQRYRYMEQCVVIGRGFNYATAFEWSLKLKELTYVAAEPYSSADFQHGPIAVVDQGYPVLAVAPGGQVFADMLDLLTRLREGHRAELFVVSDRPEALALAQSPVRLPQGMPEWATPIVSIVAGQLFSYYLTLAKGYDTEAPRGLRKVTETQ
jgi:glucosamine--fructose-6-phosphate aminotransferase (isomerizing)